MAKLPSFRPRQLIGYVVGNEVLPDIRFLRFLDQLLNQTNTQEGQRPPTGSLLPTLASTEPSDGQWLLCNGQSISTTSYPELFAIIGYTFGGSGASFSLPDAEDLILMGAGGAASLLGTAGALTQTLSAANMPAHTHGITDPGHTHTFTGTPHNHTITDPGHTHSVDQAAGAADAATGSDVTSATGGGTTGSSTTGVTVNNATAGGTNASATTGISVDSAGSGTAFSILPPVLGVNFLIKT
ncbi:phage tail protein [Leisingera sp. ANG-M7]|uniref:phage tail protein n=1 Tax=Leisingera sp. ANG-M7 TaxID=1577902 RepID=UPI00068CD78C|nr:tail fiber protein [Leisingera sp. ANG-M7]